MSLKKTDQTLCFLVGLCFSVGRRAFGWPNGHHRRLLKFRVMENLGKRKQTKRREWDSNPQPGNPATQFQCAC